MEYSIFKVFYNIELTDNYVSARARKRARKWNRNRPAFANDDWMKGQIAWGQWEWRRGNKFHVDTEPPSAIENIKVRIYCEYYPDGNSNFPYRHVWVVNAHTLKAKNK